MVGFSMKKSNESKPFDIGWDEAQQWCNFVVFKLDWLPDGLSEKNQSIRPESELSRCAHRVEFDGSNRALSIKQFLYDWAPPAYDHPCLWRNAKISAPENTPLPKPYLIGNNYLWFGLDYRRKPSAAINLKRTQIEITSLKGQFEDEEIAKLVKSLAPADHKAEDIILNSSFSDLMYNNRHDSKVVSVPTSYFHHIRDKEFKCFPYPAEDNDLKLAQYPGSMLAKAKISDYQLDSIRLYGPNEGNIQEVEYYFESTIEPGTYIYFLSTHQDSEYAIQYPPKLGDQKCEYSEIEMDQESKIYHAWSKNNENGCHTLIFKVKDSVINCIIKPAPWTTVEWAENLCKGILNG